METRYKEVYFDVYCPKCKFQDNKESDDPCHECLNYSNNEHSHKPVCFEDAHK